MYRQSVRRLLSFVVVLNAIFVFGWVAHVSAQQMNSTHYQVNEAQFGSGSQLETCSTTMCAKTSAGDLTAGDTASDNYSAQTGFNTTDEPLLEVSIEQSGTDAGVLSSSTTGKVSSVVKVRSYLIDGYVMQVAGRAPNIGGGHALESMGDGDTSAPGTEQFGINLVSNTTPSIGADPVQVPADGNFSFGEIATGYNTRNQFKYVDGDIVAQSDQSTGQTNYTISMILNISDVTPGGLYKGEFSAVVTPVY